MTDVKPAAEPSAAAPAVETPQFNPSDQATWSPEQREHWNETGDVPEVPKKAQEAAPAKPSEPSDSEGKPKSAADPETAPKTGEKRDRKPGEKLSAAEEIAKLRRELKEERERSRAPGPKPASAEPAKAPETPKRPNPFTFKGTPEEFEAAQEKWESHLQEQAVRQSEERQKIAVAAERQKADYEEAKQRYADFETVIKPTVETLLSSANDVPAVVQQALNRTPHLMDVIYVLGEDPKALSDFISTAKSDPVAAIQKLFFVEQEVAKELAKSAPKPESAKGEAKSESEDKPPVESKPRAPKPVAEVGGRGAAPIDAAVAAAQANDFSGFEKEMNRRLLGRAGR